MVICDTTDIAIWLDNLNIKECHFKIGFISSAIVKLQQIVVELQVCTNLKVAHSIPRSNRLMCQHFLHQLKTHPGGLQAQIMWDAIDKASFRRGLEPYPLPSQVLIEKNISNITGKPWVRLYCTALMALYIFSEREFEDRWSSTSDGESIVLNDQVSMNSDFGQVISRHNSKTCVSRKRVPWELASSSIWCSHLPGFSLTDWWQEVDREIILQWNICRKTTYNTKILQPQNCLVPIQDRSGSIDPEEWLGIGRDGCWLETFLLAWCFVWFFHWNT